VFPLEGSLDLPQINTHAQKEMGERNIYVVEYALKRDMIQYGPLNFDDEQINFHALI